MGKIIMSDDAGPNFLNIFIYMAAGAFLTYIWLNKTKTQTLKTADLEEKYLLQSQNNELLNHLKLLNETLDRRDNLLNEYQQTVQKQYQNMPTLIGSTINTELQQLALYLDSINTQLEQINGQVKQILDENHQYKLQHQMHREETRNIVNSNSDPVFSPVYTNQKDIKPIKPVQPKKYNKIQDVNEDLKTHKNENSNDKWSIKRGTDGRIKSLDNVQSL